MLRSETRLCFLDFLSHGGLDASGVLFELLDFAGAGPEFIVVPPEFVCFAVEADIQFLYCFVSDNSFFFRHAFTLALRRFLVEGFCQVLFGSDFDTPRRAVRFVERGNHNDGYMLQTRVAPHRVRAPGTRSFPGITMSRRTRSKSCDASKSRSLAAVFRRGH